MPRKRLHRRTVAQHARDDRYCHDVLCVLGSVEGVEAIEHLPCTGSIFGKRQANAHFRVGIRSERRLWGHGVYSNGEVAECILERSDLTVDDPKVVVVSGPAIGVRGVLADLGQRLQGALC